MMNLMQRGTVALFFLIVGLLVVGLVSVFIFGRIKLPVSQNTQPSPQIIASAPKQQFYNDQKLGFELQYPTTGFQVQEDSEEEFNKRGNGDYRKNFTGYVGYEPGRVLGAVTVLDKDHSFEINPFSVWVFDNPDNLTPDQWFDRYWYYPFVWGVFDYISKGHIALDTEATISGQPAKSKIISYQPGKPKFVYVSNNGKMYLFRIIGETGDQILSTLNLLP